MSLPSLPKPLWFTLTLIITTLTLNLRRKSPTPPPPRPLLRRRLCAADPRCPRRTFLGSFEWEVAAQRRREEGSLKVRLHCGVEFLASSIWKGSFSIYLLLSYLLLVGSFIYLLFRILFIWLFIRLLNYLSFLLLIQLFMLLFIERRGVVNVNGFWCGPDDDNSKWGGNHIATIMLIVIVISIILVVIMVTIFILLMWCWLWIRK